MAGEEHLAYHFNQQKLAQKMGKDAGDDQQNKVKADRQSRITFNKRQQMIQIRHALSPELICPFVLAIYYQLLIQKFNQCAS
jgi:hypothetical protein